MVLAPCPAKEESPIFEHAPPPPELPRHPEAKAAFAIEAQDRSTKSTARWALGLAFLPIVPCVLPVSAVLAVLALVRGRPGRDDGRGLAIWALSLVSVWGIGYAAIMALVVIDDGRSAVLAAPESQPGENRVFLEDLQVGACIEGHPDVYALSTVAVVPCSEPHRTEVYAEYELDEGTFPGDDKARELAEDGCLDEYPFHPTDDSDPWPDHELFYYYPFASNWPQDREVTCVLVSPDMVTGSLQDRADG